MYSRFTHFDCHTSQVATILPVSLMFHKCMCNPVVCAVFTLANSLTSLVSIPLMTHWLVRARCSSWCDGLLDRSLVVDPLSYFSFHPVPHDRCNKRCGICYPVCRIMHIKESLLPMWRHRLSSLAI